MGLQLRNKLGHGVTIEEQISSWGCKQGDNNHYKTTICHDWVTQPIVMWQGMK